MEEFRRQDYALSKTFKTSSKYGYQPVPIDEHTGYFLNYYFEVVIPIIRGKCAISHDSLWIKFNGEPDTYLGRHITNFFVKSIGKHITSNGFRCFVESRAKAMEYKGILSKAQRESIHNLNGHTSGTSGIYYALESQKNAVEKGVSAFNASFDMSSHAPQSVVASSITPNQAFNDANGNEEGNSLIGTPVDGLNLEASESPSEFDWKKTSSANNEPPFVSTVKAVYGTEHDQFSDPPTCIIKFSDKEREIVKKYCMEHPDEEYMMANCARYIKARPELYKYFHKKHIQDGSTLRAATRDQKKRKYEDIDL